MGKLFPLVLLAVAGCAAQSETRAVQPPKFSASDPQETARWAAEILKPLNASPSNEIAAKMKVEAEIKPLVGQEVSWGMDCSVHEIAVTLTPNLFGPDGRPVFAISEDRPVVLAVLNHEDRQFLQLDVSEQISRDEAAKLPERVRVNAKIQEIKVRKFDEKSFLLYFYLSDIKLSPVEN